MTDLKFPLLQESNNIFNDIMLPLKERRMSLSDDNKYIFFYRYIGMTGEREYKEKIISLHREFLKLGSLYLLLKNKIDIPFNSDITNKLNSNTSAINLDMFFSGDIADIFEQNGLFSAGKNTEIHKRLKEAFREVIKLYSSNEKPSNASIGLNFAAKLLCWVYDYVPKLFEAFTVLYNPKVLYYGSIKKHEGYFLILLSLLGCDIIFINSFSDDVFKNIDRNNKYSRVTEEGMKVPVKDLELLVETPSASIATNNKINTSKVVLIESEDIFCDILIPISKRKDYMESPVFVYPVYFQRHLGIEDEDGSTVDNYYNIIFNLDKKLRNSRNGYVRFENQIPMPSGEETVNLINEFEREARSFNFNIRESIVEKVMNFKSFPKSKDPNMNFLMRNAFKETMSIYLKNEQNINPSRMQNFMVKLIVWINRYINSLFKDLIKEDNPKILYYGDIKSHEVYLLLYFSKLGCDVIYINPDFSGDKSFEEIDRKQEFTTVKKLSYSKIKEAFPAIERQVRKSTVAYNASQEIQQVIYGDSETGLFKPWQFENGITRPIGLKTTFDELKILWNEPAKVRPEFRVDKDTVYVPSLFAKINGVTEQINDYWMEYKYFIDAQNTYVISSLPFTKVTYSKQDMYSSAFLFNQKGLVDEEKLFKSPLYKLGYLKITLQNFIVYKMNELILSKVFKNSEDDKFKLKILMTIINMDNDILKLLEKFDYTSDVPKLVIYANSRESFSEEDIILIAFLNLVGADIAVFTPTNYNNLELALRSDLFDVHQLPSVAFDLTVPNNFVMSVQSKKSLISRLFDFKGGNKK